MSVRSGYRRKLYKESRRQIKERASTSPPFPVNLKITNKAIGFVFVTAHAWARFFKRYSLVAGLKNPGWYAQEYFVRKLQDTFGRAEETNLEKTGTIRRLIDNNFVPVRYFLDEALKLRFVVKDEGVEQPVLLTVEIATRK